MGHDGEQKTVLYMDGKPLGPVTYMPEPVLNSIDSGERILGIDLAQGGDFTITFAPKFPRISRKQFIRNLVKNGCPKKKAKEIAWKVQKGGRMSYGYANLLYTVVGYWKVE